jgi:uncharacterized cupin superfamily protein
MTDDHPRPPALDPATVAPRRGTDYPAPFDRAVETRERRALGDALGLTNLGVNLARLPPGCASAQRHWHTEEDEFVWVLEGEVVLVTDGGEQTLKPGMAAGFPAGRADGHHLINRTSEDAVLLEVGDRRPTDQVEYPDIDLRFAVVDGRRRFVHKDGSPY